ncbi:MAG: hypothetical protein EOP53_18260 [Sphingobacteriales bacterium]|nr:MAG: hypothetical protein EOP53_18260 [Sphingobacteriales bacterium]
MELKEIVSITGKPGLYKVIARTNQGIIVESLDEKKTRLPISANSQVAILDEITIYTADDENIALKDVLSNIKKYTAENSIPNPKDDTLKLKQFFAAVAPGYDEERVYASDMKKVIKWYELLDSNNLIA